MPELDGVTIIALASFGVLVMTWLLAPKETIVAVSVSRKVVTEPAAA